MRVWDVRGPTHGNLGQKIGVLGGTDTRPCCYRVGRWISRRRGVSIVCSPVLNGSSDVFLGILPHEVPSAQPLQNASIANGSLVVLAAPALTSLVANFASAPQKPLLGKQRLTCMLQRRLVAMLSARTGKTTRDGGEERVQGKVQRDLQGLGEVRARKEHHEDARPHLRFSIATKLNEEGPVDRALVQYGGLRRSAILAVGKEGTLQGVPRDSAPLECAPRHGGPRPVGDSSDLCAGRGAMLGVPESGVALLNCAGGRSNQARVSENADHFSSSALRTDAGVRSFARTCAG